LVCGDCVYKLAHKLTEHHKIDYILALCLAEKVVARVERRPKQSRLKRFSLFLRRWVFYTNWRATLFWSFRRRCFLWIGVHGSDYSQNCSSGNAGNCNNGVTCTLVAICTQGVLCTPTCPSALPNSSQTSNSCTGTYLSGCTCGGSPKKCAGSPSCSYAGSCGYTCNTGYIWNGTQCVGSAPTTQKNAGDGCSWVTYLLRRRPKLDFSGVRRLISRLWK